MPLVPVKGRSQELLRALLDELLTEKHKQILNEQWQLCFSRHRTGIGRFRASIYFHGGCPEMAIRVSESVVRSREALRLPPVIDELTRKPNGLILITAGSYGNVIRLLMPLVVTDPQMDEALDVLESALAAVSDKKGAVAQLV